MTVAELQIDFFDLTGIKILDYNELGRTEDNIFRHHLMISKIQLFIFVSILTTFESSIILGGSGGSIEIWLEPKTKPPWGN
jgi:hypothetical protein